MDNLLRVQFSFLLLVQWNNYLVKTLQYKDINAPEVSKAVNAMKSFWKGREAT